ncbi:S24/S26 family peptidase [Pedobacter cryoconitis]|uniref:Phage repressor protein C with HTH and peptisase S24 domain n=1 Tax=Pedobacter cryoconitis TaxID=188932 RepID=A0A7X0J5Y3_9SPHI|nr:S24/S26 family peptidase [Pedobacter cryoconitis]MBB6500962.1 phage repressor protein C with HTH and peptisase S24 domain [Pedobacter cryoconitis]
MLYNDPQDGTRVVRITNESFFKYLKTYLDQGKKIVFTVSGDSMYPFLKSGSRILLKSIELNDVKKGRVVLAEINGQFILHRIVAVSASEITLAGDGNLIQNETVEIKNIWAVVTEVLDRRWNRNIQSPFQLFLAFVWYIIRPVRLLFFKLWSLFKL